MNNEVLNQGESSLIDIAKQMELLKKQCKKEVIKYSLISLGVGVFIGYLISKK